MPRLTIVPSLTVVRERFRATLIDLVQETVAAGADLPRELAEVFPSQEPPGGRPADGPP